ncbi:metal-dependent transcriptional regulator [Deinococcus sp. KNUC1210]|uniref:metal-dependent transcriptional regulator n=1 Tax=Deinococcus sp. KNUC1210 TaxID=2917691 RepID=UPI001EF0E033|nr:metal-dependent transcriptional regulator [Deinococcus sp. KNUC1210]ULH16700.1 metal-dependent transcriptional regulator [Deinococcus sp. KNUC1210]
MSDRLLSHAAEDYLKQLYLLSQVEPSRKVGTQALADALSVTPASTTGMLRKLSEMGFVTHAAYQGAALTPEGEALALEVLRHHRLLEAFLHQALGYPLDEIHDEAERLEHVISENFEARMAAWLGHPTHDPHGDPIPALDGSLPSRSEWSLSRLQAGEFATVARIPAQDPAQVRSLVASGLTPGAELLMLGSDPAFGTLTLRLSGGPELTLSLQVAERVLVTSLPTSGGGGPVPQVARAGVGA